MHVYFTALTPQGVPANAHRIHSVVIQNNEVVITMNSFVNREQDATVWQDVHTMSFETFCATAYPWNVLNFLVSERGPFPGGEIIHDPTALMDMKRMKTVRVTELRKTTSESGCETSFGWMDTTVASQTNIQAAFTMATLAIASGQPFSISWRRLDNTEVTLNALDMITMGREVVAHVERAYRHSWSLKSQIEAATTVEELEALNVEIGWTNLLPEEIPAEEPPVEEGE